MTHWFPLKNTSQKQIHTNKNQRMWNPVEIRYQDKLRQRHFKSKISVQPSNHSLTWTTCWDTEKISVVSPLQLNSSDWATGNLLPLNAIRLQLWLFAFLIIAGMLFEACDKHSTTPSQSRVACTHSSTIVHPQTHTQTRQTHANPVWVVVSFTTCANQSVESNLSRNL